MLLFSPDPTLSLAPPKMPERPCKRSSDGKKYTPPKMRSRTDVTFREVSGLNTSSSGPTDFAVARAQLESMGLSAAATQSKQAADGSMATGWNKEPGKLTQEELAGFVRRPNMFDTFEDVSHFACSPQQTVASVVSALLRVLKDMDFSYKVVVKHGRGEILVNACVDSIERVTVIVRLYCKPPTELAAGGSNELIVACQRRSGNELAAWRIFHELRNKSGLTGQAQPLPPLLRKRKCALCEPDSGDESDGEDDELADTGPPEIYMKMLESPLISEALTGAKSFARCACHGPLDTASAEPAHACAKPSVCLAPASYAPALPRFLDSLRRTGESTRVAQRAQLSHSDRLDPIRETFVCIGKTIGDVVAAAQASPQGLTDHFITRVAMEAVGPLAAYCSEPDKDVEGARILLKSLAQLAAAHPILKREALPGLESALAVCDSNSFLKKTVELVRQYLAGLA